MRVGDLDRMFLVVDDAEKAGHGRDVGLGGGLLGLDLVAHRGDGAGVGSDEDDAGLGERARKGFALGQEAVAGMHRLRAGLAAGLDDLVDHQIAFGSGRRPDQNGLIGHFDMQRVAVGFGIDRNRLDPHAAGGLDDPAGDLAAIGDQNSFEHVLAYWTFGRDTGPAIWHAGAAVTIPSYSKTKQRQRSRPNLQADFQVRPRDTQPLEGPSWSGAIFHDLSIMSRPVLGNFECHEIDLTSDQCDQEFF